LQRQIDDLPADVVRNAIPDAVRSRAAIGQLLRAASPIAVIPALVLLLLAAASALINSGLLEPVSYLCVRWNTHQSAETGSAAATSNAARPNPR